MKAPPMKDNRAAGELHGTDGGRIGPSNPPDCPVRFGSVEKEAAGQPFRPMRTPYQRLPEDGSGTLTGWYLSSCRCRLFRSFRRLLTISQEALGRRVDSPV